MKVDSGFQLERLIWLDDLLSCWVLLDAEKPCFNTKISKKLCIWVDGSSLVFWFYLESL